MLSSVKQFRSRVKIKSHFRFFLIEKLEFLEDQIF